MSAYLYALLDEAPARLPAEGVAGSPVRVVDCDGLVAVVSELGARPSLCAESLEAHDRVVRALASQVPATLPARFGQVKPSLAELLESVTSGRSAWRAALTLVAGCVQMSLRVFAEGPPAAEPARDAAPVCPGERAGTRYLLERVAAERRRSSLPEARGLLEALAPLVRDQRIDRAEVRPLLGSVYHLIPAPELEAYRRRLAEHPLPDGLRLSVSGPWAPYAFTPRAHA